MDDKTKGKVKQAEGKAQEMWGDLKDKAEDAKDKVEDSLDNDERATTKTTTTTTTTERRSRPLVIRRGPGQPGPCRAWTAPRRLSAIGGTGSGSRMASSRRTGLPGGATTIRSMPTRSAANAQRKSVRTPALSMNGTEVRSSTTVRDFRPAASTSSSQRAIVERSSSSFTSTTGTACSMIT